MTKSKLRLALALPFMAHNALMVTNVLVAWIGFVYTGQVHWVFQMPESGRPELAMILSFASAAVTLTLLFYKPDDRT